MTNSSRDNQHNSKKNKIDIYSQLDNMAINIEKLFETLGIESQKHTVKTPNTLIHLVQYLLTNNTVLDNLEALNEQIKEAVQKNEEMRLDAWSSSQSITLTVEDLAKSKQEIIELKRNLAGIKADVEKANQVISEKNNELESIKQSYSNLVRELEKSNMNFVDTLIAYRDSIILREGLAASDKKEESSMIQKLLGSLLKETANLMEKNGIEVLNDKGSFDSSIHIVTDTRPTSNKELHEKVAEVFRPGYKYGKELIRPQEVILYTFKG